MNANRRYGHGESVVHQLEPIDIDASEGQIIDPRDYGRAEAVVVQLPPVTFDTCLAELVVRIHAPTAPNDNLTGLLALDVYAVMTALSDYDKVLGGLGLHLIEKTVADGMIELCFLAIRQSEVVERMQRLAAKVNELWGCKNNGGLNGSLVDALERTTSSSLERLKLAIARRDWKIECSIEG